MLQNNFLVLVSVPVLCELNFIMVLLITEMQVRRMCLLIREVTVKQLRRYAVLRLPSLEISNTGRVAGMWISEVEQSAGKECEKCVTKEISKNDFQVDVFMKLTMNISHQGTTPVSDDDHIER